jgi:hypothetical protein
VRRKTTAAKTKLGRQPAAFQLGDRVRAHGHALPFDNAGRGGTVTKVEAGPSGHRVEFEDGRCPTSGYLKGEWLDRED